ncbi:MAG TPA: hypothetical protein VMG60_05635 [Burkholderiaceae bacterium]|nr:hypothetical protein [Burkholderiaceae bacterium]
MTTRPLKERVLGGRTRVRMIAYGMDSQVYQRALAQGVSALKQR